MMPKRKLLFIKEYHPLILLNNKEKINNWVFK